MKKSERVTATLSELSDFKIQHLTVVEGRDTQLAVNLVNFEP